MAEDGGKWKLCHELALPVDAGKPLRFAWGGLKNAKVHLLSTHLDRTTTGGSGPQVAGQRARCLWETGAALLQCMMTDPKHAPALRAADVLERTVCCAHRSTGERRASTCALLAKLLETPAAFSPDQRSGLAEAFSGLRSAFTELHEQAAGSLSVADGSGGLDSLAEVLLALTLAERVWADAAADGGGAADDDDKLAQPPAGVELIPRCALPLPSRGRYCDAHTIRAPCFLQAGAGTRRQVS